MTIPSITPLPPPPSRSDAPNDFTAKADASLAAQAVMVSEINLTVSAINDVSADIDQAVIAAADHATAAAGSAAQAAGSATAAGQSAIEAHQTALQVGDSVEAAQAAAAAAQSSAGLPALAGKSRRPLVVSDDEQSALFGRLMSLAGFIDLTLTNAAASGAVALDLSAACTFDLTLSDNTTLSVTNVPTLNGETLSIIVRIRQGATARTLGWWAGITWINSAGAPAAPAANKLAEFVLTYNGTSWLGRRGASN